MIGLIIIFIMLGIPTGVVMLIAEILIGYSRSKEARVKLENLVPRRDTSKDTSFPDLQNTVGGKRQDQQGKTQEKQYQYTYTSNGTPVQGSTANKTVVQTPGSQNAKWQTNNAEPFRRVVRKRRGTTIAAASCFAISGITFFGAVSDITEGIALHGLSNLSQYADSIPMLLISIACLIAGLWIVISKHRKEDQANRYIAIINQGYGMIPIDNIAYLFPKKYDACVQDLQEMINKGMLPDAYIDYGRRLLVIDPRNSSVEPLIPGAEQNVKAGNTTSANAGAASKSKPKKSEADHVDFLSLERLSKKVSDEDIKIKLIRISGTLKMIGQKAEEDPSIKKDVGVDTFMEMYLPKTIRLVEEYEEVNRAASLPEDNELKGNILDTLDAIDNASMTLWQNIIHSDMIDISTELDALQTKLVMDGYSESDFNKETAGSVEPAEEKKADENKEELPELKPETPIASVMPDEDVFSKIRRDQEKAKEAVKETVE